LDLNDSDIWLKSVVQVGASKLVIFLSEAEMEVPLVGKFSGSFLKTEHRHSSIFPMTLEGPALDCKNGFDTLFLPVCMLFARELTFCLMKKCRLFSHA
jgi:hypothetical protein